MKRFDFAITVLFGLPVLCGAIGAEKPQADTIKSESRPNSASRSDGSQQDTIQLVNGDQLTGRVLSVNAESITLQTDVLGQVTLPRKHVAAIQLGQERSHKVGRSSSEKDQPQQPRISEGTLIKELQARGLPIEKLSELQRLMPNISLPQSKQTPEDVIRQLRERGISQAELNEVQANVPLLAVPGVRSYFDQTLKGLIAGQLDLHDLRQEAVKARDGLKDIQKDLGPNGAALNGYLMILESFLEQTEGSTSTIAPAAPPSG